MGALQRVARMMRADIDYLEGVTGNPRYRKALHRYCRATSRFARLLKDLTFSQARGTTRRRAKRWRKELHKQARIMDQIFDAAMDNLNDDSGT